jgi:thioredoxin reductase
MTHDVIVVGGSFAGLSAAMQLARARRRVLVIDAGRPRNRFAPASHGFFGLDRRSPAEIRSIASAQLSAYPTVEQRIGEATDARAAPEGFEVAFAHGGIERAKRLILASGVVDEPPPIPGVQERWGVSVLHCPYCHGYELDRRPLGVLANHPQSAHQAILVSDWGPTTLFPQGAYEPEPADAALLASRGVSVDRTPVVEAIGPGRELEGVRLADGRIVAVGALFTAPKVRMASPLAERLGCAFEAGVMGPYIRVDDLKATTVPGVFAAGDAASPMHNATFASAGGVMAGVAAHRSLIWDAAPVEACSVAPAARD